MQTITVAGNIGKVAVKQSNGRDFLTFSLAANEKDGQGVERTTWYSCTSNNIKVAEYLKPGTRATVTGRFSAGIYHGQNGPSLELKVSVNQMDFYNVRKDTDTPDTAPAATAPAPAPETVDSVPF